MPMYTFHCRTCGSEFELFLRPSEAIQGARCPVCGKHTREQADEPTASAGPACDLSKKT
jgi:putative FmdB family regulatory protein